MVYRKSVIPITIFLIAIFVIPLAGCESSDSELGVSITGLNDGDEVWGIVKLVTKVSGDDIDSVKFYHDSVDENNLIGTATSQSGSKYGMDWYTQDLPNGQITLYAVAYDSLGDFAQDAINASIHNLTRADAIPRGTVKLIPQLDPAPPKLMPEFKAYWHDPVPLEGPINTAGAEDSPFITPDGKTFYFWFKGDATKTVHEEVEDPTSGIYWSKKVNGEWQEPEKLHLQYYDQLSLDGAHTVRDDKLWFVSIREGNLGGVTEMEFWIATFIDGRWTNWQNAGERLNREIRIGEMHITADGNELYFDSMMAGGKGQKDIYVTRKVGGEWQDPEPINIVNTEMNEGWPYISEDGTELWFTRATPGPEIFRSLKVNGEWQEPEKIIGPMAGEPTLDDEGNIYFTHHWWNSELNRANEADFYVCYRK